MAAIYRNLHRLRQGVTVEGKGDLLRTFSDLTKKTCCCCCCCYHLDICCFSSGGGNEKDDNAGLNFKEKMCALLMALFGRSPQKNQ